MHECKAKAIVLTGVLGTMQNEVAVALDALGVAVADTNSLVGKMNPDAALIAAVETESYREFDMTTAEILTDLFADISDVSRAELNRDESSTNLRFVISVPSIVFISRLCPQSAQLLSTQLLQQNVQLIVLTADIAKLILRNKLFGAHHNIVMPRRILRAQLQEFQAETAPFAPLTIDTSKDQAPIDIAKAIINCY